MKKKIRFLEYTPYGGIIPIVNGNMRSYCSESKDIFNNYIWDTSCFLLKDDYREIKHLENSDVLCASNYLWNFMRNMRICETVKNRNKHCLVVLGGPHIPKDDPKFFKKHPFVDILVHREGEIALQKILEENLSSDPDWSKIPGITYNLKGRSLFTKTNEVLGPTINFKSPHLNKFFNTSFSELSKKGLVPKILWETSRGCPFKCAFCDWGSSLNSGIRTIEMARLEEEIDFFGKNKIPILVITDSNFGYLKRDVEIAEKLARSKRNTGYPSQIVIYGFTSVPSDHVFEIAKILNEAPMFTLGAALAIQSLNPKTREAVGRTVPLSRYHAMNERYRKDKIPTYTELILGLPHETKYSFVSGVCNLLDLEYPEPILYVFFILPGADLATKAAQEKYGIRTEDVLLSKRIFEADAHEYAKIVVQTDSLPYDDWVYCFSFYEMIMALNIGGYAKFINLYLTREKILTSYDFYTLLWDYFISKPGTVLGKALRRVRQLIDDFGKNKDIPIWLQVDSQDDLVEECRDTKLKYIGQPYRYVWISIAKEFERFWDEFEKALAVVTKTDSELFRDLQKFQREIMLRPEYDPQSGKVCEYFYNWPDYFEHRSPLTKKKIIITYLDTHLGGVWEDPIVANNTKAFYRAALGDIYNTNGAIKRFHHQITKAKIYFPPSKEL